MARHDHRKGELEMWLKCMDALMTQQPYLIASRDKLFVEFDSIRKSLIKIDEISRIDEEYMSPTHMEQ